MGTMILISVVAIIVAIVGSFVIWRLDVARADEIERPAASPRAHRAVPAVGAAHPAVVPAALPTPPTAA